MRRWGLLAGALVLVAVTVGSVISLGRGGRLWTTASPEALEAFQRGVAARGKFYYAEAREHFRRALELDPEFAAAKAMLLGLLSGRQHEERKELLSELENVDRNRLSPRERFLIRHVLADAGGSREEAAAVVEEYLRRNPQDPFALEIALRNALVLEEEPEVIAGLAQRLLAADPNWAQAYNFLGYHALGRGDFAEAERMFSTYRYIAPDQANPHDSLAELYTLRGRYDEARRELEAALAIRPDFWFSYENLGVLALMQRDTPGLAEAAQRAAAAGAPPEFRLSLECLAGAWAGVAEGRWEEVWRITGDSCAETSGAMVSFRFLAALATDRGDEAAGIEQRMAESAKKARSKGARYARGPEALGHHVAGLRLLTEGQPGSAAEAFRRAEALLTFGRAAESHFKLTNLMLQAHALQLAGESEEARLVVERVQAINEPFSKLVDAPLPAMVRSSR